MSVRFAFNDMFGKGWDSAKQESFAWQRFSDGDPQFWWVPHVFEDWGHAPDWAKHKRDDKGRYKIFPQSPISKKSDIAVRLLRLAAFMPVDHAEDAQQLIDLANEFDQE